MKYKLATSLLVVAALVVATFSAATTTARPARAADGTFYVDRCPEDETKQPPCANDNVILRWDEQLLSTIRAYAKETGPTVTARALGVLHTATYDAWAAYDPVAKVTRPDGPAQQAATSNTEPNKSKAISFAAYQVLNDLFPPGSFPSTGAYKIPYVLMTTPTSSGGLGYDPSEVDNTTPGVVDTPAEVGNAAANAVLDYRRGKFPRVDGPNKYGDGSNQVGDDPKGSGVRYSDTTGYTPANDWNVVNNRWRWQPLCVPLSSATATSCGGTIQKALTPQWGKVVPFSLAASQYRVTGPPKNPDGSCCSTTDIVTAVQDTSNLSDSSKARAEYWADGPGSVFPPGHTAVFAQALSRKKGNNLDTDAKLFFLVGNAMMDASIAAWYQKFFGTWLGTSNKYDFVRPITAIRKEYEGRTIPGGWLGPNKGFGPVQGENWMPYQAVNVVTPAFPEYVSGHSTFTAAGATMLAQFNGGDTFGASVIIPAGSSQIEKGGPVPVPKDNVTLTWPTFSDASNDAGMSRRWGGIHFYTGDMHGRALGRQVAQNVWGTGQNYIKGYIGK